MRINFTFIRWIVKIKCEFILPDSVQWVLSSGSQFITINKPGQTQVDIAEGFHPWTPPWLVTLILWVVDNTDNSNAQFKYSASIVLFWPFDTIWNTSGCFKALWLVSDGHFQKICEKMWPMFYLDRWYSLSCLLRIPAMYEVKNSKICNFWTFWPVIQLINHLFRFWKNGIITELSTKISNSAVFASCIARILKKHLKTLLGNI